MKHSAQQFHTCVTQPFRPHNAAPPSSERKPGTFSVPPLAPVLHVPRRQANTRLLLQALGHETRASRAGSKCVLARQKKGALALVDCVLRSDNHTSPRPRRSKEELWSGRARSAVQKKMKSCRGLRRGCAITVQRSFHDRGAPHGEVLTLGVLDSYGASVAGRRVLE
ncbi:hypothetical protein BDU57DRAFT_365798 [Ampelomyces quisqualis]|uniref:Uncharacterized protein n=1 Tax=Ampelomyces quisqualis TaxID=50730 RepID=A0A6A5QDD3_AMPQU|nr:hypothetical protein BDU57DRAFT_365798 [Ampelomyces quisqualis]